MPILREERQEWSTVRRERYSPLSYTRALPCPTGESFPERMPCDSADAVRPRAHTYGRAENGRDPPGEGARIFDPRGRANPPVRCS